VVSLDQRDVRVQLDRIDPATLAGKRDYVLLGVLLNTGRRRAEVNGKHCATSYLAAWGRPCCIGYMRSTAHSSAAYRTTP
jgi:hypothetical protein